MIGDLALVYDWCFDTVSAGAEDALARVREPGGVERLEPGGGEVGQQDDPVERLGDRQPARTTTTTRSCARRCCSASRPRARRPQADQWITQFRDTKVLGQLVPTFDADLVGGGSREGTGYGVAMRELFELYDLWHGDDRREARRPRPSTRARRCARSCTRSCRRSIASRRPATSRATRRRRSSTTTATTSRS